MGKAVQEEEDAYRDKILRPEDEQSFRHICGDFKSTLERCDRLLRRKEFYKDRDGLVYTISWNLTVEYEVTSLRTQVHSHIVKIQFVLDPLKSQLLSNLDRFARESHADIVNRMGLHHQELLARLERLEKLFGMDADAMPTNSIHVVALLHVPSEIEGRFLSDPTSCLPTYGDADGLWLGASTGAFVVRLEESTRYFRPGPFLDQRTPPPNQFLSLLKCAWILSKIKTSMSLAGEQPDSLWHLYVQELESRLQGEASRFTLDVRESERLSKPALEEVLSLPQDCFRIWVEDDSKSISETSEEDFMDLLIELSLPVTDRETKHRLKLLRPSPNMLRIVDLVTEDTQTKIKERTREYDIDLARVQLVPLYATPSSSPEALNLKFRDQGGAGNGIAVSFKRLKDLVAFQHAFTGYYVPFDKSHVATESFHQGSVFGEKRIFEEGRLQIWIPKKLEKHQPRRDSDLSHIMSNLSTAGPSGAAATGKTIGAQSLSYSVATNMAGSAIPALHRAKTFETDSGLGHLHNKPDRPLIVLFLNERTDHGDHRSFLTIPIDNNTFINRHACDCRKPEKKCTDSSVENKSGNLGARRYSAGTDLDSWNVAAAGQWQLNRNLGQTDQRTLAWVRITFDKLSDRLEFAGAACKCKGKDFKATDDCNKSHRGSFGQVKASYMRKLAEYNNRYNLPHVVE